jgi:elongation factor G
VKISEETGQTIISGMGELHLEVIRHRMERDFGLKVKVHKPRVSYRESVKNPAEAEGRFERQAGGESQFASVKLRIEPYSGEESILVKSALKPGKIPADLEQSILQSIRDEANAGGNFGYPLMKIKLTLIDVGYREGETTDVAAQAATNQAVRKVLSAAEMILLEPIMSLEIVSPQEFVGGIQGDLNSRKAHILGSEQRGHFYQIEAEAPLAQMFGYSTDIRSLSQGRASYSMEPLEYREAPQSVVDTILGH